MLGPKWVEVAGIADDKGWKYFNIDTNDALGNLPRSWGLYSFYGGVLGGKQL